MPKRAPIREVRRDEKTSSSAYGIEAVTGTEDVVESHEARLRLLRQSIESGAYSISAEAVADKMMESLRLDGQCAAGRCHGLQTGYHE
ncbi:MAG: flagellar biosynthesis anti-sigma factor FlgM [Janthinobacterium lividum]